jgi:hypothetical protein
MKPRILIIDGAEKGKRINNMIQTIRDKISKEILDIHYSTSNVSESGDFFPVNGYLCIFIHAGDNIMMNGQFIYNEKTENDKVPMFLFSGGYQNFIRKSEFVIEISYRLLLRTIDLIIDLLLLELGFNDERIIGLLSVYSVQKDINEFLEKLHSLKHDFLNRMGRILPEIIYMLNDDKSVSKKFVICFNTDTLRHYLSVILENINQIIPEYDQFLLENQKEDCKLLSTKISDLSLNLDELSKPSSSRKKFMQKATSIKNTVEEIKILFETIITRIENEK